MKIKNINLSLLFFLCFSFLGNSQDIHFSQFNENAALINPSLVGQDNTYKFNLTYKDQWNSISKTYKTIGAQFEMRLNFKGWKKSKQKLTRIYHSNKSWLSAGLSLFSDKAGDGNMGITQVNLTISGNIPITRNSTISGGIQAGIAQRKIDFSKLVWPEQFNGTGYDPNLNSGEIPANSNYVYPDFAFGISYNYGFKESAIASNKNFKMDIGFSVFHINQTKKSFFENTSNKGLFPKYVLHSKYKIGISHSNFSVLPSFILQLQGTSSELLIGSLLDYSFVDNSKYTGYIQSSSISIGAYLRLKDALIAILQYNVKNYTIGFSYDINTSKLNSASKFRGGFEVFIRIKSHNAFMFQNN